MSKETRVNRKRKISSLRLDYILRLIGRSLILAGIIFLYFFTPEQFSVIEGFNFFERISILHILWILWVIDMIYHLIPIKDKLPIGSMKLFKKNFKPIVEKINYPALRDHIISTTKSAYKVFLIWVSLLTVIGVLYFVNVLGYKELLLISVIFYVCDLICVLIWCPFRLIMKNKCCTTCRIFNWDHLMMFSPMVFIGSFYTTSLILLAFAGWILWELCIMMYPERFWENSNAALKCSECTDKLCTQYCKKLRK